MPLPIADRSTDAPAATRLSGARRRSHHATVGLSTVALPALLPIVLPVAVACLACSSLDARGQAAPRTGLVITPLVSAQETFSDNVRLTNNDKQADFASQGSVGVRATSNSGRVRGSVDYLLTGIVHSSRASGSQTVNALNANVTGELVTNHLFVDVTGNISQQALSAFGTQSVDSTSTNSNRTEVRTFGISPYLRGNVTPYVNYEARLNANRTSATSNQASNSTLYGELLHFGSAIPGKFGWAADANRTSIDYALGTKSTAESYKGTLIYNPNSDIALSLIGGREQNNYLTTETKGYSDVGGSVTWNPSNRTNLITRYEHRYFGNSHLVQFNYRTPLTAWNFIDSRDVTTSRVPTGGPVEQFTPLYQQLFQALAGLFPNLQDRDVAVRNLLALNGLSPTVVVSNGFLTSQVILRRTQSLSFSLLGSRSTVVFRVSKDTSSGLGNQPIYAAGLSSSNVIHQNVAGVDYLYKLNANSSVSTSVAFQRNSGDVGSLTTTLKSIYLNLNTRFTPRDILGGGVRHVIFDSVSQPYTENAVFATYSHTF